MQVYAPVYPNEGSSHAQLFSADANGSGGIGQAGSPRAGGTYQQLTVAGGVATATWVVLSANAGSAETWTFPLLVENPSSCTDVNAIQMDPTLGPVSDVAVASATATVPRYRIRGSPDAGDAAHYDIGDGLGHFKRREIAGAEGSIGPRLCPQ